MEGIGQKHIDEPYIGPSILISNKPDSTVILERLAVRISFFLEGNEKRDALYAIIMNDIEEYGHMKYNEGVNAAEYSMAMS